MTKLIRSLLKKHNLTIPWLSQKIEIPQRTLEWKLSRDKWTLPDLLKIIKAFKLSDDEILNFLQKESYR